MRRRLSLRARLALAAALGVAVAVIAMLTAAYVVVGHVLRAEVDTSLRQQVQQVSGTGSQDEDDIRPRGTGGLVQLVDADGDVTRPAGSRVALPAVDVARAVAAGRRGPTYLDVTVRGEPVRLYVAQVAPGEAVQVGRVTTEVAEESRRLAGLLLALGTGGMALAALLGFGVAGTAIRPVRRLTAAAERVTATGALDHRIDVGGRDEVARLASAFNEMLASLERSVSAQRQLVADASHELRTPLTSLRTNTELLCRYADLPADDRERLVSDVLTQVDEMTALVGDVVELARVGELTEEPSDVRLDRLLEEAVDRSQRHWPAVRFHVEAEPAVVAAVAPRLSRAVANLLDNAGKWSPAGGVVDVTLHGDDVGVELTVRDRGPGIPAEDLPHVFDRFYRASGARGTPGSGLGLAIVRQVVESTGGRVTAGPRDGGGTDLLVRFPAGAATDGLGGRPGGSVPCARP